MRLIIFDCDGTIIDSQNAIYASMTYAFRQVSLPPPDRAAVLRIVGLSLPEALAALAPDHPPSVQTALVEHYKSGFTHQREQAIKHDPLFPGAREVIAALNNCDETVLGIATGKSLRGVKRLLDQEGWHGHFFTVQTADQHPSKPHPAMLQKAMAEAGIAPEATVMIGDTTFDMEMAKRADVGAIAAGWGYHSVTDLRAAGAHAVCEAYDDLPAHINEVLTARAEA